jgi:hypothetical protein
VGTTAGRGAGALASAVRVVGLAIVALLVVHVLLTLLDANPQNGVAMLVRDAAALVDLGLDTLFLPPDPKVATTLNYGVAALVWYLVTAVVVRLLRRVG